MLRSACLPFCPFMALQAKNNAFPVSVGDFFKWKEPKDSKHLLNAYCVHS